MTYSKAMLYKGQAFLAIKAAKEEDLLLGAGWLPGCRRGVQQRRPFSWGAQRNKNQELTVLYQRILAYIYWISIEITMRLPSGIRKRCEGTWWLSQLSHLLLTSAQVMLPESWDQAPDWAPPWVQILLEILPLSLCPSPSSYTQSVSISQKKEKVKKKERGVNLKREYMV